MNAKYKTLKQERVIEIVYFLHMLTKRDQKNIPFRQLLNRLTRMIMTDYNMMLG